MHEQEHTEEHYMLLFLNHTIENNHLNEKMKKEKKKRKQQKQKTTDNTKQCQTEIKYVYVVAERHNKRGFSQTVQTVCLHGDKQRHNKGRFNETVHTVDVKATHNA